MAAAYPIDAGVRLQQIIKGRWGAPSQEGEIVRERRHEDAAGGGPEDHVELRVRVHRVHADADGDQVIQGGAVTDRTRPAAGRVNREVRGNQAEQFFLIADS